MVVFCDFVEGKRGGSEGKKISEGKWCRDCTTANENTGAELYWGGELGSASDAWVDGRYVNALETLVPGETFEDHPTSDIVLKNVTVPQITYEYEYNYDTYEYEYCNFNIVEKKKIACFYYSEGDIWTASYQAIDEGSADYYDIEQLVEGGYIDKKYLDPQEAVLAAHFIQNVTASCIRDNLGVTGSRYLFQMGNYRLFLNGAKEEIQKYARRNF